MKILHILKHFLLILKLDPILNLKSLTDFKPKITDFKPRIIYFCMPFRLHRYFFYFFILNINQL